MMQPNRKLAGTLFFVAVTQFALGLIVAEALYPTYNVAANYISDLGVGPSSLIFNASIVLLGLLVLVGASFLPRSAQFRPLTGLLILMALGTMGVGVFTKDFTTIHGAVSSAAFFFGGLSAITSSKVLKMPLSLISVLLGVMTIGALALFAGGLVTSGAFISNEPPVSPLFLGLGPGGMERMIVYPALIWLAGFSGHLLALSER